jgi:hypothetical protein
MGDLASDMASGISQEKRLPRKNPLAEKLTKIIKNSHDGVDNFLGKESGEGSKKKNTLSLSTLASWPTSPLLQRWKAGSCG